MGGGKPSFLLLILLGSTPQILPPRRRRAGNCAVSQHLVRRPLAAHALQKFTANSNAQPANLRCAITVRMTHTLQLLSSRRCRRRRFHPVQAAAAAPAQALRVRLPCVSLNARVHPQRSRARHRQQQHLHRGTHHIHAPLALQATPSLPTSYLFRLLADAPDAVTGVRWGSLASLLSFAVVRALSSSDYVAVRYGARLVC